VARLRERARRHRRKGVMRNVKVDGKGVNNDTLHLVSILRDSEILSYV